MGRGHLEGGGDDDDSDAWIQISAGRVCMFVYI